MATVSTLYCSRCVCVCVLAIVLRLQLLMLAIIQPLDCCLLQFTTSDSRGLPSSHLQLLLHTASNAGHQDDKHLH